MVLELERVLKSTRLRVEKRSMNMPARALPPFARANPSLPEQRKFASDVPNETLANYHTLAQSVLASCECCSSRRMRTEVGEARVPHLSIVK